MKEECPSCTWIIKPQPENEVYFFITGGNFKFKLKYFWTISWSPRRYFPTGKVSWQKKSIQSHIPSESHYCDKCISSQFPSRKFSSEQTTLNIGTEMLYEGYNQRIMQWHQWLRHIACKEYIVRTRHDKNCNTCINGNEEWCQEGERNKQQCLDVRFFLIHFS